MTINEISKNAINFEKINPDSKDNETISLLHNSSNKVRNTTNDETQKRLDT